MNIMAGDTLIKIQLTYSIIISEAYFFYDLFDYLKNNNDENQKHIPTNLYENLLEEYIDKNKSKPNIKNIYLALSIDNLKEHNIIHSRGQINGINYISISKHVQEIISNIYKEFDKSLNQTHYNDYVERIHHKKQYFKENTFRKTQELEDTIEAFDDLLEEIAETLRNTVNSLSFFKNELAKIPTDAVVSSVDAKLKKIKEVKKIRSKYIEPLNNFLYKNNPFVQEINNLVFLLNKKENKTAIKLHDKLIFYYTSYIYIVEEAKEIRKYFVNYIKQNEQELYWNLGSEYIFNQLVDISNVLKDGRKTNTMLWSEQEKIKEINLFFKNSSLKDKEPETIKEQTFSADEFIRYSAFLNEVLETERTKKQTQYIQLVEAEKENKRKEEQNKINIFNEEVLNKYLKYMKKTDLGNEPIIQRSIYFLNQNFDWDVSLLEYLVFQLIRLSENKYLSYIEEHHFIKNNTKITYWEINLKEKN